MLWAGTLLNRVGGFVQPLLALYLTQAREASTTEVGLVLTAFGAGTAASQPVGGVLADRWGRRPTLVAGQLASAASLLLVVAAPTLPLLAAAVLVHGLCLDLYRPASQAAVVDLVPPALRPRAFALLFWAINLGFAVAAPLAGFVAEQGFVLVFALDAASIATYALLVLLWVPETRPAQHPGAASGSLRDVLRDRLMLLLCAGCVLQAVVYMQSYLTLPLAFRADGLGTSTYGAVLGLNGLLIVVLQPLLLRRLARAGGGLLGLAAAVQGVGFGLHAVADEAWQHAVAVAVWTVGEVLGAGLLSPLVARLAPEHLRGRYLGIYGTSYGVAGLLAPLLGTQLLAHGGEQVLWPLATVSACAAGAVFVAVSRRARPAPA